MPLIYVSGNYLTKLIYDLELLLRTSSIEARGGGWILCLPLKMLIEMRIVFGK